MVSSAGSALLLAAVLRVGFDVSRVTAGLAALAYAVEPLALFYERMLMTENLATFFMAGFVFVGVAYLRRPTHRATALALGLLYGGDRAAYQPSADRVILRRSAAAARTGTAQDPVVPSGPARGAHFGRARRLLALVP